MTLKELMDIVEAGQEVTITYPVGRALRGKVVFNATDEEATRDALEEFGELQVEIIAGDGKSALIVDVG